MHKFCYILGEILYGLMAALAIGFFGGAFAGGILGLIIGVVLLFLIGSDAIPSGSPGQLPSVVMNSARVGLWIGMIAGPIWALFKGPAAEMIMDWDLFRSAVRQKRGVIRHLFDPSQQQSTGMIDTLFRFIQVLLALVGTGYFLLWGPFMGAIVGAMLYGIVWYTTGLELPKVVISVLAAIGLFSCIVRAVSGARAFDDLLDVR
jgi:hypothetical protein